MTDPRSWITGGIEQSLFDALAERLPASRLWSLLLEVLNRRAPGRTPAEILAQWQRDGFVQLGVVDQRTTVELDRQLLASAAAFEAVELSPLAPLGSCSAIARASQNKIVSALRGTELVADPTNVLALECARRLRQAGDSIVRLCTSHRCVRAQPLPKGPHFTQHFRMFVLVTAGREQKDHAFLASAMVEQIRTHQRALRDLESHGYRFPELVVRLLAEPRRQAVADRIAAELSDLDVQREPLTQPYYDGLRFMIGAASQKGEKIPFIDGGAFDWLGKLTSNRRLVLVASAMGSQLAALAYR